MKSQIRVMCGVPKEHCNGQIEKTDQRLQENQSGMAIKAHIGHKEAFDCMARYLVKVLGYKRIGSKEFRPPDGGYVRVLTRPSRYGARLRFGKEQERFMPSGVTGNRGVIIG